MPSPLCEGLSAGITAAAWVDRESLLVRVVLSYPSSDLEVVCGCGPSVGWFHLGWSLVPEGGASAAARSRIVVGVAAVFDALLLQELAVFFFTASSSSQLLMFLAALTSVFAPCLSFASASPHPLPFLVFARGVV